MDVFNAKKLIRSKSGLKIVSTNDEFKSPFVIKEPNWVPDNEISHCTNCQTKFGFTVRKHHCRRCGKIFCSCCCKAKIELHRMCFVDPVRICLKCEPQTKWENNFFDRHLKALLNGAVFNYQNKNLGLNVYQLLHCKLSADHRFLIFDGVSIPPIEVSQVTSLGVKTDLETGLKSLCIDYIIGEETKSVQLDVASGAQVEKTGTNWLIAIEEAFKLLESKGETGAPA